MKICWLVVFLLTAASTAAQRNAWCLWPYANDPEVTDRAGRRHSPAIPYFPADKFVDSTARFHYFDPVSSRETWIELLGARNLSIADFKQFRPTVPDSSIRSVWVVKPDSFRLFAWYSKELAAFDVPILYNSFTGTETYRLYWHRSFHPPVVLELKKQGTRARLVTRMMAHPVRFYEQDSVWSSLFEKQIPNPAYRKPYAYSIVDETRWSTSQFQTFLRLLDSPEIRCTSPKLSGVLGLDGSHWVLELHRPDGYYFIDRWSPDSRHSPAFRKACEYLIEGSAVRGEERY